MFIEAVIVSIDFGDYLTETLPINKRYFNRIIVVTSKEDVVTQEVCKLNDMPFVLTERHLPGFNKGKAVNDGMRWFHRQGWLCHMDADTVMTEELWQALCSRLTIPEKKVIYGCQRWMCESRQAWECYLRSGKTNQFRPDNRRTHQHWPVGFFQVWHSAFDVLYPEDIPVARSSDIEFSKQFRRRYHFEEHVIHLSAGDWKRGRDDEGRVSPPWV